MANLDPSAPSQPSLNTSYDHPSNPAESTPAETRLNNSSAASQQRSDPTQETRRQNDTASQNPGVTSLASGYTDSSHDNPSALGTASASNTEGEQMRAAGDGDIARAQEQKSGFGEQAGLAEGMEGKKEAHMFEKERRRGEEGADWGGSGNVDLGAALGGEGKAGVVVGAESNHLDRGDADGGGDGGVGTGMQSGHGQV